MAQSHKESTISATTISRFSRVCVFCGSSSGNKESYKESAIELGQELVSRNLDLVYGGGSIGLMGLVSKAVHSGGRHVIGIIPKTLIGKEKTGETVGELRQVSTMHERKSEMARLADCFIAMPGGFGTLEEVLEVITWAQLGIHDKPIGLLNVDGYYDLFIDFVDKSVNEGFVKPSQRNLFVAASNSAELVAKMEEFVLGPDQTQIIAKLKWEWDAAAAHEPPRQQPPSPVVGLKALLLADNISPPPPAAAAERKVCRRRRIDMPTPGVFCY